MRVFRGFTLAEVLITLAIIGVIASITIPNLSASVLRTQAGSSLAKAINTLENANSVALQEGNVRALNQISEDYFTAINQHMNWHIETYLPNYTRFTSTNSAGLGRIVGMTTNDGISYIMAAAIAGRLLSNENNNNLGRNFGGNYWEVAIDINGTRKGPNKDGRDLYFVAIDNKGAVIPFGSDAHRAYTANATPSWRTTCPINGNAVTNERFCTGAVTENGYRVQHF